MKPTKEPKVVARAKRAAEAFPGGEPHKAVLYAVACAHRHGYVGGRKERAFVYAVLLQLGLRLDAARYGFGQTAK